MERPNITNVMMNSTHSTALTPGDAFAESIADIQFAGRPDSSTKLHPLASEASIAKVMNHQKVVAASRPR